MIVRRRLSIQVYMYVGPPISARLCSLYVSLCWTMQLTIVVNLMKVYEFDCPSATASAPIRLISEERRKWRIVATKYPERVQESKHWSQSVLHFLVQCRTDRMSDPSHLNSAARCLHVLSDKAMVSGVQMENEVLQSRPARFERCPPKQHELLSIMKLKNATTYNLWRCVGPLLHVNENGPMRLNDCMWVHSSVNYANVLKSAASLGESAAFKIPNSAKIDRQLKILWVTQARGPTWPGRACVESLFRESLCDRGLLLVKMCWEFPNVSR
jgi:hypothetical protein